MAGVQYRGALREACSYRTVSVLAVLVIAGIIPLYEALAKKIGRRHQRQVDRQAD